MEIPRWLTLSDSVAVRVIVMGGEFDQNAVFQSDKHVRTFGRNFYGTPGFQDDPGDHPFLTVLKHDSNKPTLTIERLMLILMVVK
jgi:hypothetical protein